jgi:hypothetical protein
LGERFSELAKLDSRFIRRRQLLRHFRGLARRLAKKVKEKPFAVEKVFNIQKGRRDIRLRQHPLASGKGFISPLLQAGLQEIILNSHATQYLAV